MTSVQRTFPSVFAFNVGIELVSDKEKYVLLEEDIEHILTHSHSFSLPLRQLHVITSSFDWFTGLSVSSVIG